MSRAIDTPYGLAAGVWTKDGRKAAAVSSQLRAGSVWVNCYNVYDPAAPFGGLKKSGSAASSGNTGSRPIPS